MTEREFERAAQALHRKAEEVSRGCGLSVEAAEDVAQDVMLRMWEMHAQLEDKGRLTHLAAMMAKRLSLNALRNRRAMDGEEALPQIAEPFTQAELLEEKENAAWLEQSLQRLPETQKVILRMRQVERRSLKEIGALLGIRDTSVSTLLARARKSLLEEIKKRK